MPRPAASSSDRTAEIFLSAAAALIDRGFLDVAQRGRHPVNTLKFPPSIHWLRVEDVLRLASDSENQASRKAFHNRWPHKDSFMRDAIVYAMCYRDAPERDPNIYLSAADGLFRDPALFLEDTWTFAASMFAGLLQDPRSFLMIHLAPSIAHYPDIQEVVDQNMKQARELWRTTYAQLIDRLGLKIADGWTVTSLDLTFQALIDGFLICARARARVADVDQEAIADRFARAVCAVVATALTLPPDQDIPLAGVDSHLVLAVQDLPNHGRA